MSIKLEWTTASGKQNSVLFENMKDLERFRAENFIETYVIIRDDTLTGRVDEAKIVTLAVIVFIALVWAGLTGDWMRALGWLSTATAFYLLGYSHSDRRRNAWRNGGE